MVSPLQPIAAVSAFLDNITTTPLHTTLFPYLRFPVMHAARVTLVWAGMTKARKDVPVLQDLFGYLVLACKSLKSRSFVRAFLPEPIV